MTYRYSIEAEIDMYDDFHLKKNPICSLSLIKKISDNKTSLLWMLS